MQLIHDIKLSGMLGILDESTGQIVQTIPVTGGLGISDADIDDFCLKLKEEIAKVRAMVAGMGAPPNDTTPGQPGSEEVGPVSRNGQVLVLAE